MKEKGWNNHTYQKLIIEYYHDYIRIIYTKFSNLCNKSHINFMAHKERLIIALDTQKDGKKIINTYCTLREIIRVSLFFLFTLLKNILKINSLDNWYFWHRLVR